MDFACWCRLTTLARLPVTLLSPFLHCETQAILHDGLKQAGTSNVPSCDKQAGQENANPGYI